MATAKRSIRIFLMLFFALIILMQSAAPSSITLSPECPDRCGNVSIPYPFGIGPRCFRDGFQITCNGTADSSSFTPYLGDGNSHNEVLNISLLTGQARIKMYISSSCYLRNHSLPRSFPGTTDLTATPYVFSDAENKFMAVGCDMLAYIKSNSKNKYTGGCMSICDSKSDILTQRSKSESGSAGLCLDGVACCQSSIRKGISYYEAEFDAIANRSSDSNVNYPCSYALLADKDWIREYHSHFYGDAFFWSRNKTAAVVLDWAIRDQETCGKAKLTPGTYACRSQNSECIDSINGPGYICNCSSGFEGNPYVSDGCQDINECDSPEQYPCHGHCKNLFGGYNCSCPPGTQGNASLGNCTEIQQKQSTSPVKYVVATAGSLVFLIIIGSFIFMIHERRKLRKIKETYFEQNGGWLLLNQMKSKQGEAFKIFNAEELEEATDKFDKSLVIGRGANGTVYRGVLKDGRVVAIKKSKILDDERQKKEFGNEMIILSQVNHKNIVKLLGCCLEVEVPMLVYEYVPNGTLFHLIQEADQTYPVTLGTRLRIASESAEALAYLHSAASPPIIHGDVKSSNILLDDNYMAKVSDFGTSKLVPRDGKQFATLVQGTYGYLDPEYLQTGQLTEKSDVYSFGVVLLELLTGKKAIYFEGSEDERFLASTFISAMRQNRILDLLDVEIRRDEPALRVIQEVAELSMSCLEVRGEERPTMKEVAERLEWLRKVEQQHIWLQGDPAEMESLLNELPNPDGENNV